MRRKIVWLPYDMDTAIGINNEGALVFDYSLEDTDHLEGGADVFNGQSSVVWNNIRDAFGDELMAMYRQLRSEGALSYDVVEGAFERHQAVWPEAIFNEDAWYKYILPLIEDGTGSYLEMLQGSKAEQRKWWLYNRFRYIDSKYNAGDALSDVIQVRGYAKADITVTPYADIYPTVKYGSYLVHMRGHRGVPSTLVCPLDKVNDTEIYIYSASQLASVGDLSGLKVGFADLSMGTKLQSVKLGDSSVEYDNPNLKTLTFGNNELLKIIDVRNCSGLGTGDQKAVDASGCSILEEAYFEGTAITSLSLPNGGVVKKVHLPSTITNLTILNQKNITDLQVGSYANVSTFRMENVSSAIDTEAILRQIPANSRVRLVGIYWTAEDAEEIEELFDILDSMRGLDNQGGNLDTAWVDGEIHTSALTSAQIAEFNSRYPYVRVTADHLTTYRFYYSYDGATLIHTESILDGATGGWDQMPPAKTATAQYTFTPIGWSYSMNATSVDAFTPATTDQTVYGAYSQTLRQYTISFVRASDDGGGTLQTKTLDYGSTPTYTGATPTTTKGSGTGYAFIGWSPEITTVTGAATYTALFESSVIVEEITDSWDTIIANIDNGTYKTKYRVGNYKPLNLGSEGTVNMQIVGKDIDTLSDGSGMAPLSFVALTPLATKRKYQDSYAGIIKWADTPLRSYLRGTLFGKVPQNVRARIRNVNKGYVYWASDTATKVTQTYAVDNIWIPSRKEVSGLSNGEGQNEIYYGSVFGAYGNSKNEQRKRGLNGVYGDWFIRGASTNSSYKGRTSVVRDDGSLYGPEIGNENKYIVIGFCLGQLPKYQVRFYNGTTLLQTSQVTQGQNAVYTGTTPTSTEGDFTGWKPNPVNVTAPMDCYAQFEYIMVEPDLKYLVYTLDETNKTMTLTGLNTAQILADNLSFITIPDTIQGYHVILG